MKKTLRPKLGGLAGILAQAPAASAAFGRWPGFVLMMTAMIVVLALGAGTMLVASNGAVHLVGKHDCEQTEGHKRFAISKFRDLAGEIPVTAGAETYAKAIEADLIRASSGLSVHGR